MQLKQYVLNTRAIAYIRYALGEGFSLAHLLLDRQDLEQGYVVTFLPENLSEEQLYDFRAGGKLLVPPDAVLRTFDSLGRAIRIEPILSTLSHLVLLIHDYLRKECHGIAVFQDGMAEATDKWVTQNRNYRIMIAEGRIYHFLTTEDAEPAKIERVVRRAETIYPPLIGVMAVVEAELLERWREDRVELRREELSILAAQADRIVIGAYDGEGYLLWVKP
jgi:hypothetical protein